MNLPIWFFGFYFKKLIQITFKKVQSFRKKIMQNLMGHKIFFRVILATRLHFRRAQPPAVYPVRQAGRASLTSSGGAFEKVEYRETRKKFRTTK